MFEVKCKVARITNVVEESQKTILKPKKKRSSACECQTLRLDDCNNLFVSTCCGLRYSYNSARFNFFIRIKFNRM